MINIAIFITDKQKNMKSLKYIVPNGITLINLLAGSFAAVFAMEGYIWIPVYLLIVSAVADLLDGLMAKLFDACSEFGKQLDSLADLVSFGLAPSILIYQLLVMVFVSEGDGNFLLEESTWGQRIMLFSAFNIVAFTALRLARFNIQEVTGNNFKGMPVPASALLVVAIWIVVHGDIDSERLGLILNYYFIIGVIVSLSVLMISNIPMISLKFDGISLRLNTWKYILLAGSAILYVIFGTNSLLFIMLYYIVLSLLHVVFGPKVTQ